VSLTLTVSSIKLLFSITVLSIGCTVMAQPKSSEAAQNAIAASTSAILQGDSTAALKALRGVSALQFLGKDADHRVCMLSRFDRKTPPRMTGRADNPFIRELLSIYQDYWWHTLKAPAQRGALDSKLLLRLRALLGASESSAQDMDAIEKLLDAAVKKRGYRSISGRTPPLFELMIWKTEDVRTYEVDLPESRQSVKAVLLSGFVSSGWSHYGLCGRSGAGGWVGEDAVYAVASKYDLNSEEYRVSLLAHESQHFADLKQFPKLASWSLEYRAKLTELWAADETRTKLLKKFAQSQSDDMDSPHTYANKRLLIALRKQLAVDETFDLTAATPDRMKEAARLVLVGDTERLSRVGGDRR
jgi:hypothetical protein